MYSKDLPTISLYRVLVLWQVLGVHYGSTGHMHCRCGLGSLQYLTPWVGMCSSLVGVKRVLESSTRTLYKEMVGKSLEYSGLGSLQYLTPWVGFTAMGRVWIG